MLAHAIAVFQWPVFLFKCRKFVYKYPSLVWVIVKQISYYLNKSWLSSLTHIWVTKPQRVNDRQLLLCPFAADIIVNDHSRFIWQFIHITTLTVLVHTFDTWFIDFSVKCRPFFSALNVLSDKIHFPLAVKGVCGNQRNPINCNCLLSKHNALLKDTLRELGRYMAIKWGLGSQKQVSRVSNYIPQILCDVITCP